MGIFEAFGFAVRVLQEAYWVNETAFRKPDQTGRIVPAAAIQDTEDGLSEIPHVILIHRSGQRARLVHAGAPNGEGSAADIDPNAHASPKARPASRPSRRPRQRGAGERRAFRRSSAAARPPFSARV